MNDAAVGRVERVDTPARALMLAEHLRDPSRAFPVVLLTTRRDEAEPPVDAVRLAGQVGDLADVWLAVTGPATRALAHHLGPDAIAYNGAVRCYPVGLDWVERPALARFWLAPAHVDAERVTREIERTLRRWAEERQPRDPSASRSARVVVAKPSAPVVEMSATLVRVTSVDDAQALGRRLLDPARTWPIVVISAAFGEPEPFIDATEVLDQVAGMAEVAVLPTDARSWALSALLPAGTDVYGGAARVYPPDPSWQTAPGRAPLVFAYDRGQGVRAAVRVVDIAIAAALDAGVLPSSPPPGSREVSGTVIGIVGERALVDLGGGRAAVRPDLVVPGVPLTRLVAPGMRVSGSLDPATNVLDLRAAAQEAEVALRDYRPGVSVLAEVAKVTSTRVVLRLYPGVEVEQRAVDLNLEDTVDLADLFAPGDVVAVAAAAASGGQYRCEVLAEIPDDVTPPPAILPGGPPWLAPGDDTPEPEAASPAPAEVPAPLPTRSPAPPPTPGAASAMKLTIDSLQARVRQLEAEIERAAAQIRTAGLRSRQLEAEVLELRTRARAAERDRDRLRVQRRHDALRLRPAKDSARTTSLLDAAAGAFADDEEQFRFEVQLAWAERIPAAEKADKPLAGYVLGPDFLASLASIEGIERRKVVREVADLLVAFASPAGMQTIDMHPLRAGMGGDDGKRVRADGATGWRVALQRGTPSARRLHLWKLGSNVELARVVLHDDFEA